MADTDDVFSKLTEAMQNDAPRFADIALARRFCDEHGNDLRYVAAWGKWFSWDETRWRQDETQRVVHMMCKFLRDESGSAPKSSAKGVASARTVAAVLKLASANPRIAATVDQWDRDKWLLNTPAGIIDLRSGRLRAARREDYCTKITAVVAAGECPLWHAFLDRITDSEKNQGELKQYLQRVAGYCLTGVTHEHALFFGYGDGDNGKTVFSTTISEVMGDYAITAPMEVFVASKNEHHPTELAMLRGARLVTAAETEAGRYWAEAKLKLITGGEKIQTRFMHKDFFEYLPQFKPFIIGNQKPALRHVDEAIRRRMHFIPFAIKILGEEKDKRLSEKLREEWSGILQWMIDGCTLWLGEGLAPPEVGREATEEYLAAEDAIGQWIEDKCDTGPRKFGLVSDLFQSWRAWAEAAGEAVGSQKAFSQALAKRFQKRRQGGTGSRGFDGINVKVTYQE